MYRVPSRDPLAPQLIPAAHKIVKSFGGWEQFMRTYGLKPHEQADVWEATRIAERMAQEGETTAGTTRAPAEESTRGDLDPHLSVSGREIIKSFGGWTNFLHAYNLKEYNQVDVWEGKRIVERMLKESEAVPVPTSSKTG